MRNNIAGGGRKGAARVGQGQQHTHAGEGSNERREVLATDSLHWEKPCLLYY